MGTLRSARRSGSSIHIRVRIAAIAGSVLVAVGVFVVPAQAASNTAKEPKSESVYLYSPSGRCEGRGEEVTFKKTRKVFMFQPPGVYLGALSPIKKESDRLRKYTFEAGDKACRLHWSLGPVGVGYTDGVVTSVRTPGYPTVADIKALGISTTTTVADDVWIPRPDRPETPAQAITEIKPLRLWTEPADPVTGQASQQMIEWEFTGGAGLLIKSRLENSNGQKVHTYDVTQLNPNGSVVVRTKLTWCDKGNGPIAAYSGGTARSDFGQGHLPPSMQRDWSEDGMTPYSLGDLTETTIYNALLQFDGDHINSLSAIPR